LDKIVLPQDQLLLSHWPENDSAYQNWGVYPELKNPRGEYQQWFVVAAKGNPAIKSVIEQVLVNIDRYNSGIHRVGKPAVIRVTGPIAFSKAIERKLDEGNHRIIESECAGFKYRMAPDQRHRVLLRNHYTTLAGPLVHQTGLNKLLSSCFHGLRWALKRIR
ncbi:MAG: hypothetical protein OQJ91_18630, partial [Motiliproteus sp.]|nr:hypothetical protein [Motiliproteus sp.]